MHAQLLHGCRREGPRVGAGEETQPAAVVLGPARLSGATLRPLLPRALGSLRPCLRARASTAEERVTAPLALSPQPGARPGQGQGTFEGLPADLAEVGPALLVAAGHVPQQGPLLREALLAELTAEGPLAGVGAVVLVEAGCGDKVRAQPPGLSPRTGRGRPASPWVRKVLPQRWHWKGFSPVCVRRCMLRLAFWVKAWLQNSQTYGLSFLSRWGHGQRCHRGKRPPWRHCSWEHGPARATETGKAEAGRPEPWERAGLLRAAWWRKGLGRAGRGA